MHPLPALGKPLCKTVVSGAHSVLYLILADCRIDADRCASPLCGASDSAFSRMDILHSYWRMEYVTSPSNGDKGHSNPFADLPKMGDDRAAYILYRGNFCYIVLNRYPYNPGHMLVVPYREVADIVDLTDDERDELFALVVRAKKAVQKIMHPDGYNIGLNLGSASGAGIPTHLHMHIVPRWKGDNNFMSVIGQTRSLTEALDKTWDKLNEACREI